MKHALLEKPHPYIVSYLWRSKDDPDNVPTCEQCGFERHSKAVERYEALKALAEDDRENLPHIPISVAIVTMTGKVLDIFDFDA